MITVSSTYTRQVSETVDWPKVTVIIVTKGNRKLVLKAIESVVAVEYPPEHMQVVVLEESDEEPNISLPGVDYHRIPVKNLGVGYARNTALKYARNDIIVFTDDDCLVDRLWLKELVQPLLNSTSVAAVAGAVRVTQCGPVGRCENILGFPGGGLKYVHKSNNQLVPVSTFSTCNCSINLALINPVRFKEGFQSAGEDELLSRSISSRFTILYNPRAIVYHRPRDSFKGVFQWFVRRGQARVAMMDYREDKLKYTLQMIGISPVVRLAILTALYKFSGLPLIQALLVTGFVYYVSVIWRFRWTREYGRPLSTFLLLPLVKSTMDIGLDIGTVRSLGRTRRNK